MATGASDDPDEVEVELLRLEWLALVGTSRVAQRLSHTEVAAWCTWTRWQTAKEQLEAKRRLEGLPLPLPDPSPLQHL
ncbi:MAG: hypothetical protein ACREOL_03780 [Candidatus Dormibacteria bacterium]